MTQARCKHDYVNLYKIVDDLLKELTQLFNDLNKKVNFRKEYYNLIQEFRNNNNNNNNNSYILVTSIRLTHEGNLCYVCRVNKILWGRKSLAAYTTATRSRDDKTETIYQICSRWLHIREWMFLSF